MKQLVINLVKIFIKTLVILEILYIFMILMSMLLSKLLKKFKKNHKSYLFIYTSFEQKQWLKKMIISKIRIINFILIQIFLSLSVLL